MQKHNMVWPRKTMDELQYCIEKKNLQYCTENQAISYFSGPSSILIIIHIHNYLS